MAAILKWDVLSNATMLLIMVLSIYSTKPHPPSIPEDDWIILISNYQV